MPKTTLGVGVAKTLHEHGVTTVFGIPGVHNVEMYRGLERAGITHILARHEQGAGFMADGYARATGKPGVAFVITGPGLTNIMTPMGQAYSDSIPMLVISSCLPAHSAVPGQLHEMRDQTGAAATVCDWSVTAEDGQSALAEIGRAFAEFPAQRPRPKHISIPIDVLAGPCPALPNPLVAAELPQAPEAQIEELAARLKSAKNPLFIFGRGAIGAEIDARQVVEKTRAAVFTTYAGRGVILPDYPFLFGASLARTESQAVIAQADLVVVVGSELAQVDLWRDHLGHNANLVRVDIDPEVLNDQHNSEIRVHGDARTVLRDLNGRLDPTTSDWSASAISGICASFRAETDATRPGILPFVEAMRRALPDETLIFSDMTQFAYVGKEIYPLNQTGRWHHPFGFGTLGYGLPAAIGGKIGCPDLPVVAIAGDSGFQYTMCQLGLAAELSLSLPIILWDNGRLKEIQDAMEKSQITPNAVVAANPNFELLAKAYGINYVRPVTPDEFEQALTSALAANGPTIVHLSPQGAP